jgi:Pyruvate/2-oxoacid:ferredoxin oxidoreductase gamma subunit
MDPRAARTYAPNLKKGTDLVVNSTLVTDPPSGPFRCQGVDATRLASEAGIPAAANMAALGAVLAVKRVVGMHVLLDAISAALGPRKSHLAAANLKVLEAGFKTTRPCSIALRS